MQHIINIIEKMYVKVSYAFIRRINDEYMLALMLNDVNDEVIAKLSRLASYSFELLYKFKPRFILINLTNIVNCFKRMISRYGEIIKPIIYRLAYMHGSIVYEESFNYADRPVSKFEKFMSCLVVLNVIEGYEIRRMSILRKNTHILKDI